MIDTSRPKPQRLPRAAIAFLHDLLMAGGAFVAALLLRVGTEAWTRLADGLWLSLLFYIAVAGAVFLWLGLYRGIWRYASMPDVIAIGKAATFTTLIFLLVSFMSTRLEAVPRSALIISWLLLVAGLSASRFGYRLLRDRGVRHILERGSALRVPVILLGAGDEAEVFVREMARSPKAAYEVLGLVDESGLSIGRRIHGVPVLGGLKELPAAIERLASHERRPQRLILTQALPPEVLERLLALAEEKGMTLARLPRLTDLGRAEDLEPGPVAIEDLLGRPQATLDRLAMRKLVEGRRVLIAGAGGSIGSELVGQIAALRPSRMILLDANEFALYQIDQELGESNASLPRQASLADVRDGARLKRILAEERPELVFHAAALKHVPLVEENPLEGILTNAIGTRRLADSCRECGVLAMVLISTDKAVNPTSVMGASKRLAEAYCQSLDVALQKTQGTRFLTVRFGNVLGSTGSVVPLFNRQIAAGGPVTVTHPEMTRYFMTVKEAVELVLQATTQALEHPEEAGQISVLDMGQPVKIVDLAEQMIRLAGLVPDKDIKIVTTQPRPGEKLHEELFHAQEALKPTPHPSLRLAAPRIVNLELLSRALEELEELCLKGDEKAALALICRLVPEYLAAPGAASAQTQKR